MAVPIKGLSMKQLVEITGINRQTIHYYLREGLIPGPISGAGTRTARYAHRHAQLLELLKDLRANRGMSLSAIRRSFKQAGFDPDQARANLGGPRPLEPLLPDRPAARKEMAAAAGCPLELVDRLVDAGLVEPEGDGRFDRSWVEVLVAVRRLAERGMPEDAIDRLLSFGAAAGEIEGQALLADLVERAPTASDAESRAEERHRNVVALLDAVCTSAGRRALRRMDELGARSLSFARDAIYIPSDLFVQRFRLDRLLVEMDRACSDPGVSPETVHKYGRLLLGLGRYPEACRELARAAEMRPRDPAFLSYLGVARALCDSPAEGVITCARAVDLAPSSPRARTFHGITLGLLAATTGAPLTVADTVRAALRTVESSRSLKPADLRERMETLLARGRLLTVLPGDMPGHGQGVADLEEVVARTESATDAENGFDLPGSNALYRIHALFFLGIGAWHSDHPEVAAERFRECITIDPASRFAERAYEMLARLEEQSHGTTG